MGTGRQAWRKNLAVLGTMVSKERNLAPISMELSGGGGGCAEVRKARQHFPSAVLDSRSPSTAVLVVPLGPCPRPCIPVISP